MLLASGGAWAAEPSLIPWTAEVVLRPGAFTVDRQTPICAIGAAGKVAERLRATLKAVEGLDLTTRSRACAGIGLVLSEAAPVAETDGYSLDVDAQGVRIVARTEAGLY